MSAESIRQSPSGPLRGLQRTDIARVAAAQNTTSSSFVPVTGTEVDLGPGRIGDRVEAEIAAGVTNTATAAAAFRVEISQDNGTTWQAMPGLQQVTVPASGLVNAAFLTEFTLTAAGNIRVRGNWNTGAGTLSTDPAVQGFAVRGQLYAN